MNNPTDQFMTAIAAAGLTPPDVIHGDGVLHRFSASGRRGDDSGWYVLHLDGVAAGSFGCWRTGLTSSWSSKPTTEMTVAEREAHHARIQAMKRQRDAEQGQRHEAAAVEAVWRFDTATPCTQHTYLNLKGVNAYGVKVDANGALLIPMRDTAGKLHSLQTIGPDGDKRFLFGGRVKGCYHAIGKPKGGRLIVCEGYATGASIHQATGEAVAVAFNAGNLESVATALHRKYTELVLILAADDDHQTEGNPGMVKARAAALAVGGFVAAPQFPSGRPDKATDFNDLHQLAGLVAVRTCFNEIVGFVC